MPKKKKAKKRKSINNDDVDCDTSEKDEDHQPRNELRPTKKLKLTESSSSSSNYGTSTSREDSNQLTSQIKLPKQKKKKKKKSKKKTNSAASSSKIESDDEVDSTTGNHSSQVNMEGMMVDDQMVLVDRSKDVVYSMNEKHENGEYKQIGTIGKDGQIIIAPVNDDKEEPSAVQPQDFPFETDPDDHCESPLVAYQDILPFLTSYSETTDAPYSSVQIYDPYYCNGGVANHLKTLGFPNVYNQKEDCYQVWSDPSRYPAHDIVITNPPYSGDHIENLVKHVTSPAFGNRPWMLLLPQWVHKKDYYVKLTKNIRPFYLVPHKRYVYVPPPDFRQAKKSDVHKKSSPFVSMWFIWGGTMQQNERWISKVTKGITTCDVARSKSALRDLRRKGAKKK